MSPINDIYITHENVTQLNSQELGVVIQEYNRRYQKQQVENLLSAEAQQEYLQYAPKQFVDIWKQSTPEEQLHYMKYVQFGSNSTDIRGTSDRVYTFAKTNIAVSDADIVPWEIEKNWEETYFTKQAILEYTKKHNITLPTEKIYGDILDNMPWKHTPQSAVWKDAWKQLFAILGSNLTWELKWDIRHFIIALWALWMRSTYENTSYTWRAQALISFGTQWWIAYVNDKTLFPARELIEQKPYINHKDDFMDV